MKSVATHAVAPPAFRTVTVQETTSLILSIVVDPLVWPIQLNVVAAVGTPTTVKEIGLPWSGVAEKNSEILKLVVRTVGAVTIKEKKEPPPAFVKAGIPVPLGP